MKIESSNAIRGLVAPQNTPRSCPNLRLETYLRPRWAFCPHEGDAGGVRSEIARALCTELGAEPEQSGVTARPHLAQLHLRPDDLWFVLETRIEGLSSFVSDLVTIDECPEESRGDVRTRRAFELSRDRTLSRESRPLVYDTLSEYTYCRWTRSSAMDQPPSSGATSALPLGLKKAGTCTRWPRAKRSRHRALRISGVRPFSRTAQDMNPRIWSRRETARDAASTRLFRIFETSFAFFRKQKERRRCVSWDYRSSAAGASKGSPRRVRLRARDTYPEKIRSTRETRRRARLSLSRHERLAARARFGAEFPARASSREF